MIVGVLLAAGAGARFGGAKLLVPLEDGTPVGVRSARSLASGVERVLAVVRPGDARIASLLEAEGIDVLSFPGAAEGMGASLAYGVGSAPEADGWVVALADMPFVAPETVAAVAGTLKAGAAIVAPSFGGRRGHPVGFGARFFPDLTRLRGDEGARSLLARYSAEIVLVECGDSGCVRDIDRMSDLRSR